MHGRVRIIPKFERQALLIVPREYRFYARIITVFFQYCTFEKKL